MPPLEPDETLAEALLTDAEHYRACASQLNSLIEATTPATPPEPPR